MGLAELLCLLPLPSFNIRDISNATGAGDGGGAGSGLCVIAKLQKINQILHGT